MRKFCAFHKHDNSHIVQVLMCCRTEMYAWPSVMVWYGGRVLFDKAEHCCVRGAFPFCFRRGIPNEIGTMTGLFAPSAPFDKVKVLVPAPYGH
jgi:hypothetical protein